MYLLELDFKYLYLGFGEFYGYYKTVDKQIW